MKKLLTVLLILLNISSYCQISFSDSTTLLTIQNHRSAFIHVGVVDMNNDFLDDIIRLRNDNYLSIEYQNPDGSFTNYGLGIVTNLYTYSFCVSDVDKNGFNDILLGAEDSTMLFYADSSGISYNKIYLPGSFFDQTANFVDIDNDGWIELFICNDDSSNYLYENDGNGNFSIDTITTIPGIYSGNYGSVWSDYDNDGDVDVYISKCKAVATSPIDPRRVNRLYRNDGSGIFTEVGAAAGVDDGAQSWAADFGDIDNDGDFDLFVADMYESNKLYENLGSGIFADITSICGIDTLDYFQCRFSDFDNDGYIDLILGKFIGNNVGRVYKNNGNKTFTYIPGALPDTLFYPVKSFAIGDLNQDGFLDLLAIIGNNRNDRLLINNGNSNNYVMFSLIGTTSNVNAIGARLELYGPWGIQVREVRSGEGYGIMNSFTQHFGIGSDTLIDSLIIKWPSGLIQKLTNFFSNQLYIILEGVDCNLSSSASVSDVTCYGGNDGIIDLTISGGTMPYLFSWSNGDTTEDISGIFSGTYNVIVTDSNGCIVTNSVMISESSAIIISTNSLADTTGTGVGIAWVIVSGEAPPYSYQWTDSALQTNDTAYNLITGTYYVIVTDSNGCNDTANVTVGDFTGKPDNFLNESIKIYPNPSDGKFNLEFNLLKMNRIKIKIFNSLGQVIYYKSIKSHIGMFNKKINLNKYPTGIYLLQFQIDNNLITEKIILLKK